MASCDICKGKFTRSDGCIDCIECKVSVHGRCTGLAPSSLDNIIQGRSTYKCSNCKAPRRMSITSEAPTIIAVNNNLLDLRALVERKIVLLEEAMKKLSDLTMENKSLREVVDVMREQKAKSDERIEKLEERVQLLTMERDDHMQKELSCTLEIQSVPDELILPDHSETVINVIKDALEIDVPADQIEHVQLIKADREKMSGNMFLLKLSNHAMKRKILASRREIHKRNNFRGVYLKDNDHRIFVNERLTARRRELLREAKLWRKKLNYKFIWVNEGRIMMRKREGDKLIFIDTYSDFSKLR